MNDQNIALIQQYLNKELSETELILFKKKLEDEEFVKEVMIAKSIYETRLEEQKAKSNGAFEKAEDLAKRLGEDLYSNVNLDWEYPIDIDVPVPVESPKNKYYENYVLYEPFEKGILRGTRTVSNDQSLNDNLLEPTNEEDYSKQILITLNTPFDSDLKIRIFDNKGNKVKDEILAANNSQLIISTDDFLPGLYYMRFKVNSETLFRKFYIQKHLMPDELKPDPPKEG